MMHLDQSVTLKLRDREIELDYSDLMRTSFLSIRPAGSTPPIRSRFASSSSISRSQTESCPTDHGPAVPDSGSGPCGISCPSTHPIVSSLHGWTASAHVALGSCLARGGSRLDQAGCRTRKGSLKCLSLRRPRGVQDGKGVVGAGEERVLETIPGHRRKYRSPQRHHRVNR